MTCRRDLVCFSSTTSTLVMRAQQWKGFFEADVSLPHRRPSGQVLATGRTSTFKSQLYKPASAKEVVTTKKQRLLLQDNLTRGPNGHLLAEAS